MSAYCLDCRARTERVGDGTLIIIHAVGCPNRMKPKPKATR